MTADYADLHVELEQLESELEAIRVVVDEGGEMYASAPTARETALRHLEIAVRHVVDAAWALIEEADWDEPEDALDAIEILGEEDVIPGPLAVSLVSLAEYATEHGEAAGWDADAEDSYERLAEAVDSLAEYQEYLHQYLQEAD